MADRRDQKIAMLIDADNVSYKKIEEILNEVNRYGIPTIKRIYGDWTSPFVENWKPSLLTHAITPIQQYSYTHGKNSTDSALIIDAMDILHLDRVDGFCIVSSDSDFTRLATRLRESGKLVIGIGERKTPKPFIASCDKFIYVEILDHKSASKKKATENNVPSTGTKTNPRPSAKESNPLDDDTLLLLKDTVDDTADESGWAFLGEIGNLLIKRKPDFDARNYGFEKISHLFKSRTVDFEVDERTTEKSKNKLYYVRNILTNETPAVDTTPVIATPATEPAADQATLPSPRNKITADDVRKNQIRITKDLKPLFPTRTRKITIIIQDKFECTFSHRRDRSDVLNLGKEAAAQLGLAEDTTYLVQRINETTYKLSKATT
ncbi:NYN domain-containing protein [Sphingobacterium sp. lm-10]|uniref:NYN domain-containing protein n=1 Tax=Sphingobacterium sp. lm-10 TaxID=2944904 RepID=UPI002022321E|nr:NYN domain-containing protein [Sphingobacterium sp. lm-10]MCL7987800.1 NYN domain-containing protein [Sphingobacterium sp. lm-10]